MKADLVEALGVLCDPDSAVADLDRCNAAPAVVANAVAARVLRRLHRRLG